MIHLNIQESLDFFGNVFDFVNFFCDAKSLSSVVDQIYVGFFCSLNITYYPLLFPNLSIFPQCFAALSHVGFVLNWLIEIQFKCFILLSWLFSLVLVISFVTLSVILSSYLPKLSMLFSVILLNSLPSNAFHLMTISFWIFVTFFIWEWL